MSTKPPPLGSPSLRRSIDLFYDDLVTELVCPDAGHFGAASLDLVQLFLGKAAFEMHLPIRREINNFLRVLPGLAEETCTQLMDHAQHCLRIISVNN